MRTSIWFVRHGQTELNKARRYQGASNSPLTPFGERQAAALAQRLRRIPLRVAVVSPCLRAQATAEAILADRQAAFVDDARWAETNHGRWEGLTYAEVRERFPAEAAARFADPLHGRAQGGESLAEVAQRVAEGWRALLQQFPGGRVLVVSHATPIQLVLCMLSGLSPALHWRWRVDLGSVTSVDVYGGGPIIRMVNEVPRL
ncbi:histidine phosphatase family protein [Kouleothrix sp.]|uniref:histidine phosphatase family protein n=1 Tax=Kouleothrix sp. TaxID=2779161 RepID=UPI00391D56DF